MNKEQLELNEAAQALADQCNDMARVTYSHYTPAARKQMLAEHILKHLTALSEQWEKRVTQLECELKFAADGYKDATTLHCKAQDDAAKLRTERDQLAGQVKLYEKDVTRLDWLEENGELQHLYEEGRPETTAPVIAVPAWDFDFIEVDTIRDAIDASLRAELAKGTQ